MSGPVWSSSDGADATATVNGFSASMRIPSCVCSPKSAKLTRSSILLPGIAINTGPADFRPIEQMRLVQFDGNAWQPIGDVIESAFLGGGGDN